MSVREKGALSLKWAPGYMSLEAVIFTAREEAKELPCGLVDHHLLGRGRSWCVCVGGAAGLVLPLGGDPAGEAGSPPGGQ